MSRVKSPHSPTPTPSSTTSAPTTGTHGTTIQLGPRAATPASHPSKQTLASATHSSRPLPRKPLFFRRVALECNQIFDRLRTSLAHEDYSDELIIESLFEDQDHDEALSKLMRTNKGYTLAEEIFLQRYKKYKLLDKLAMVDDSANDSPVPDLTSATATLATLATLNGDDDVLYRDVDVCKMRVEMLLSLGTMSDGTVDEQANIGASLWEYRRAKWTHCTDPDKVARRRKETSLANVPRDVYAKIYTQLVDKGRALKSNKHLNLQDAVNVINAGWVAEEKWDRAAKGLP